MVESEYWICRIFFVALLKLVLGILDKQNAPPSLVEDCASWVYLAFDWMGTPETKEGDIRWCVCLSKIPSMCIPEYQVIWNTGQSELILVRVRYIQE